MEYRRFELIDKVNEEKLLRLLDSKKLSREDLVLILKTIKLRNFNKQLENVSTKDLVNELKSRESVKSIAVGLYKSYSLKEKYKNTKLEIECDNVLVIDYLDEV